MIMNMHDILRQDPKIWDLFTRKEEYNNRMRDQYDRFPYYASKNRDIFEPKASQYLIEQNYSIEYPDNAPFAVILTHDIDNIFRSLPVKGFSAVCHFIQGNYTDAINEISLMRSKNLPFRNFSAIMDLEEKYGAKSTFFFMAENPNDKDYAYNIEDLKLDIRDIIDRGWEVGLHGGHTTYLDPQEMENKKVRLEKITHRPVVGYRNHFLRFRIPDTWEYLFKAGFQYDSTLGYPDCIGFRNGMCHPFRPFNLNKNKEIPIIEIPLVIMDLTLGSNFMRLDDKESWNYILMIIDRIIECHGVFTLLWHNENLNGKNFELYEKILKLCKDRKAWMTNGSGICSLKDLKGIT